MSFRIIEDPNAGQYKHLRPLANDYTTCPDCGGKEFRCVDQVGQTIKDGDRDTPDSYDVLFYVYECRECGGIFKGD